MLTQRGFAWDREWMVVDASGDFVTQRSHPKMALIETELSSDALVLRCPSQTPFVVPTTRGGYTKRRVAVWSHSMEAMDEGDAAAEWFSSYLGNGLRLVRFPPDHRRLSDRRWTGGIDAENRFSDGYPILAISEESLMDLNSRIPSKPALGMDRFRPNLVFSGGGAYFEDQVGTLEGAGFKMRIVKPCTRCSITATDQRNGVVGIEPLPTLAKYRRDSRLNGVVFGQNVIPLAGFGQQLSVGTLFTTVDSSEQH